MNFCIEDFFSSADFCFVFRNIEFVVSSLVVSHILFCTVRQIFPVLKQLIPICKLSSPSPIESVYVTIFPHQFIKQDHLCCLSRRSFHCQTCQMGLFAPIDFIVNIEALAPRILQLGPLCFEMSSYAQAEAAVERIQERPPAP